MRFGARREPYESTLDLTLGDKISAGNADFQRTGQSCQRLGRTLTKIDPATERSTQESADRASIQPQSLRLQPGEQVVESIPEPERTFREERTWNAER